MCLMAYLGTAKPIPVGSHGLLTITAVAGDRARALAHGMASPHRYLVGIEGGCSCDFASSMDDVGADGAEHALGTLAPDRRERSAACVRDLIARLRDLLAAPDVVELFAVWSGDEARLPVRRVRLELSDIVPERFLLMEGVLLTVGASGPQER